MRHKVFIIMALTQLSIMPSLSHSFQGQVLNVKLQEQTQIAVKLVPDLGTRLIFPFILDDPQLKPPLNYKLTNTRDFNVARSLDAIVGQNVFLVTTNGKRGAVGKLYISIAGYHLALNLGISASIDDHISDIYFNLTKDDRGFLIAREIASAKAALDRSYQRRLKHNKEFISNEGLAQIINYGTSYKNIKQLFRGGKDKFATADIYLDKFVYRKRAIYALKFWVEHYSSKFVTSSILVQAVSSAEGSSILEGNLNCFVAKAQTEECIFMTTNQLLIDSRMKLIITLTNDKDEKFVINY